MSKRTYNIYNIDNKLILKNRRVYKEFYEEFYYVNIKVAKSYVKYPVKKISKGYKLINRIRLRGLR